MNTFKMQCINYLLVRGWVQDEDGYPWVCWTSRGIFTADSIGDALNCQLEWDDEGPN